MKFMALIGTDILNVIVRSLGIAYMIHALFPQYVINGGKAYGLVILVSMLTMGPADLQSSEKVTRDGKEITYGLMLSLFGLILIGMMWIDKTFFL